MIIIIKDDINDYSKTSPTHWHTLIQRSAPCTCRSVQGYTHTNRKYIGRRRRRAQSAALWWRRFIFGRALKDAASLMQIMYSVFPNGFNSPSKIGRGTGGDAPWPSGSVSHAVENLPRWRGGGLRSEYCVLLLFFFFLFFFPFFFVAVVDILLVWLLSLLHAVTTIFCFDYRCGHNFLMVIIVIAIMIIIMMIIMYQLLQRFM